MDSFAAIIEHIGAPELAKALGLPESHVRVMKARDSIPPDYWRQLIELAESREIKGIDWITLSRLREGRFASADPTGAAA